MRVVVTANGTALLSVDHLGSNGSEFYQALSDQKAHWEPIIQRGASLRLPDSDRRYADTASSLLTMYMNADQGLTPEYGMGQFWNTYNTYVPLDTTAIGGALLEWGLTHEAQRYIGHFLQRFVHNATGQIDYGNFGCDNDANYGRVLDLFVRAVEYSANTSWARAHLPTVHAMASNVLRRRAAAVLAFPPASPLHGIVPGSPDHDICHAPGYYFASQVWFVRGLLSLHRLHAEYPYERAFCACIDMQFLRRISRTVLPSGLSPGTQAGRRRCSRQRRRGERTSTPPRHSQRSSGRMARASSSSARWSARYTACLPMRRCCREGRRRTASSARPASRQCPPRCRLAEARTSRQITPTSTCSARPSSRACWQRSLSWRSWTSARAVRLPCLQRHLLLAHASDTDLRSRLFVGYLGENHRGSSRRALVCAWQIAGRFWA